jgi:PTH1 family peptidyl-tRNA hydrolase
MKQNHSSFRLVVGLGNTGTQYKFNRHNVGFMANDMLITALKAKSLSDAHHSQLFKAMYNESSVLIVYPQTYMNESGLAVQALMAYYKIPISNVLILCDDFDLDLGVLRLREKGTAGTHNGLKSVIQAVGMNFNRLRIGIGPLPMHYAVTSFVLNNFTDAEQSILSRVLTHSTDVVMRWLNNDTFAAIQQFANTPISPR